MEVNAVEGNSTRKTTGWPGRCLDNASGGRPTTTAKNNTEPISLLFFGRPSFIFVRNDVSSGAG